MKKRLLALCLAAALLLGMMPALTMPAKAVETVTDVKEIEIVTGNNTGVGYGDRTNRRLFYTADLLRLNGYTWSGTKQEIPALSFDHTKEMLLEQYVSFNWLGTNGTKDATYEGLHTVGKGRLQLSGIVSYTLYDADTGKFLYYGLTGDAETGCFQVRFLKEDDTMEDINLGFGTFNEYFTLGIRWNVNDTVTVLVNGVEKGTTTADVTWTADTSAELVDGLDNKYNPRGYLEDGTQTNACDFLTIKSDKIDFFMDEKGGANFTKITHTEYVPTAVEAIFTAEELKADGALDESSWAHASVKTLGGYETSVLANAGNAYVALKGEDGEVSVKLGDVTETVNVAGGVAEVVFEGAVKAYGATAELLVGGDEGVVTFATKEIKANSTTETLPFSGMSGQDWLQNAYFNTSARRFDTSGGGGLAYLKIWKSVDHSKEYTIGLEGIRSGNDWAPLFVSADEGVISSTGSCKGFRIVVNDFEGKAFYVANLYLAADATPETNEDNHYNIRFYVPTQDGVGTNSAPIDLGIGLTDANTTFDLDLRWNTNGTVDVLVNGVVKGSVDATWTYTGNKPTTGIYSLAASMDEVQLFMLSDSANRVIFYIKDNYVITETTYVQDITTTLAQDLAAAIEDAIDTNNLASVPAAINHPYLGTVALTWSDSVGLIADGVVATPDEDTVTTLTAMAGDDTVWTGAATVKANARVYGYFAQDLDASWIHAISSTLGNYSVSALATDKDTVYVSVKGADGDVAVSLGGVAETVSIVDGEGIVVFDNVGLESYTDSVDFSIAGKDTKLVMAAKSVNVAGTVATNTNYELVNDASQYISYNIGTYRDYGEQYEHGRFVFQMNSGVNSSRYFEKAMDLDHSKTIRIDQRFYIDPNATLLKDHAGISVVDGELVYAGTLIRIADVGPNGGVIYIQVAFGSFDDEHGNDNRVYTFLMPDGTEQRFNYGSSSSTDYNTGIVWGADGSVQIIRTTYENDVYRVSPICTVEGATWTLDQVAAAGLDVPTQDSYQFTVKGGAEKSVQTIFHTERITNTVDGLADPSYDFGIDVKHYNHIDDIELPAVGDYKYSIDLGSDIGFNFYIPQIPGATITVNAAGNTTVYNAAALTPIADGEYAGKYLVEANVAAAQMTEDVRLTVVDPYGFELFDRYTNVKTYAEQILNDGDTSDDALVNKMLAYGGVAQTYFNYNTNDLVSTAAPSDALLDVDDAEFAATQSGSVAGIEVKSATLVLDSKVVIRYYFNAASVDGLTFVCNGELLTPEKKSDGVWYVDVEVNPQNMNTMYTVTVNDALSVTYSCMTYMTKYANDAKVGTLLKAMYDYHVAAAAYVEAQN